MRHPLRRHVLAEEHHVRLQRPGTAVQAVHHPERPDLGLGELDVAVRLDRAVDRHVPGPRIGLGQPLVELLARADRPAGQAPTRSSPPCSSITPRAPPAWCRPSTFWVITPRAGRPVAAGRPPGGRVRPGMGDALPAAVAARPVTLPGRRAAGELLKGHRGRGCRAAGRPAVVGNAGLGGQARPGQRQHLAAAPPLLPAGAAQRPGRADRRGRDPDQLRRTPSQRKRCSGCAGNSTGRHRGGVVRQLPDRARRLPARSVRPADRGLAGHCSASPAAGSPGPSTVTAPSGHEQSGRAAPPAAAASCRPAAGLPRAPRPLLDAQHVRLGQISRPGCSSTNPPPANRPPAATGTSAAACHRVSGRSRICTRCTGSTGAGC